MEHFKDYSIERNGVKIQLNFSKSNQLFHRAQWELDNMVMTSMVPYMPIKTGSFIQRTRTASASVAGTGKVFAAVPPFGRYQYMGKVMVDSVTGKGPMKIPTVGLRFHIGAKLVATDRDLVYGNPDATPRWFDTTKAAHGQAWVNKVKKIVGGGLGG